MSKLSKKQQDEIKRLANMPDSEIDTSTIPEISSWTRAEVGRFYRPVKKQVTLRLDVDMLEWFKNQGNKYQTRINQALRDHMDRHHKAS